jgi:MFS family permease
LKRSARHGGWGIAVYALAAFGAHVSYAPLLALLLPRRIVAIAPDRAAAITSLVILLGAVTASLAHIGAGRLSDRWRLRHGNRRAPIALGLALTMLALAGLGFAHDGVAMAAGLVAFQVALNLMFAPIGAVLVDHFADQAKGQVAALVNLAMPLAAMGTGVVALVFPRDGPAPFVAVAALVGLSVVPLLVTWPFAPAWPQSGPGMVAPPPAGAAPGRADWARVGLARLLMQSGAAFMMSYFYLFLVRHPARAGIMPGQSVDPVYGRLVVATTVAVLIVTVVAGRWSDRRGRRRAPMMVAAVSAALALALLLAGSGWVLLAGYGLFQIGLIAYLALDTALVAQLLGNSRRPGEMLGYLNLANTLPSIAVPSLVLALSRGSAEAIWAPGFAGSVVCCLVAAGLVARIRAVA